MVVRLTCWPVARYWAAASGVSYVGSCALPLKNSGVFKRPDALAYLLFWALLLSVWSTSTLVFALASNSAIRLPFCCSSALPLGCGFLQEKMALRPDDDASFYILRASRSSFGCTKPVPEKLAGAVVVTRAAGPSALAAV